MIGVLTDYFKRVLVYYPPAMITNIEASPSAPFVWLHFITVLITGIETVINWRVATNAAPRVSIGLLCGYMLHMFNVVV